MGLLDILLGRGKRAVGEAIDRPELREQGRHQERSGESELSAREHEEQAQAERERAAREEAEKDRLSR